jgi:hypothetical protein
MTPGIEDLLDRASLDLFDGEIGREDDLSLSLLRSAISQAFDKGEH